MCLMLGTQDIRKLLQLSRTNSLPRTNKQHDSIKVVVDKLTKAAHFIPIKLTHKAANIVDVYMK
jgi:hypothetical protein